MTLFRMFILMGAVILIGFFSWPWIDRFFAAGALSGEISLHAGGMTATVPAIMGLFATLGLAAMLWTVRR
ncbi:MAG TPA: DUF2905 family protein [Caulobacteraceae bacterium]|nr:DUF2905 family protein [Caulobacteraceae bacterium]